MKVLCVWCILDRGRVWVAPAPYPLSLTSSWRPFALRGHREKKYQILLWQSYNYNEKSKHYEIPAVDGIFLISEFWSLSTISESYYFLFGNILVFFSNKSASHQHMTIVFTIFFKNFSKKLILTSTLAGSNIANAGGWSLWRRFS